MAVTLNASTSTGYIQTADTSGDLALQSNGTTQFNVTSTGAYGQLKSGTAVASTSGTSIDFTSLPSWVKRITIQFVGVSTSGTSPVLVRSGAGSIETSGYLSASIDLVNSTAVFARNDTSGFSIYAPSAAYVTHGNITLTLQSTSSNTWAISGTLGRSDSAAGTFNGGSKSFSGVIDRVRITTVNGTDTFDAGSINILYEG